MKVVPIENTSCQQSFVEILKVMCQSWKLCALGRFVDEQLNSYLSYITALLKDFVCEIACLANYITSDVFVDVVYDQLIREIYRLIFDALKLRSVSKTKSVNYKSLIKQTQPYQVTQHFISTSQSTSSNNN
jgi:hypothetical protein